MDLIKSAARRSRLGDVTYIVLNLAFAGVVFGLTVLFDPPIVAYLLILLSKWRVLAVRPRFWFANIQTNVVDVMVGLSAVTLIWLAADSILVQLLLGMLFAAWLLIAKPRSRRRWVLLQAGISQFVALTALFSVAYLWPSFAVVLAAWLIGYSAARHALGTFDDESKTLLGLVWGLVIAEFAWLAYHWTIAYAVLGDLKVPQVALFAALFGFVGIKLYANYYETEGSFKLGDLRWPLLFAAVVVIMLLVRFSGLDMTEL